MYACMMLVIKEKKGEEEEKEGFEQKFVEL